jgi:hypothetical protein
MKMMRREFLQVSAAGCTACMFGRIGSAASGQSGVPVLVSPGCRRSKVRVARLYLGVPKALWPDPKMDLKAESERYEAEFLRMKNEFADVDFVVNEIVTRKEQVGPLAEKLKGADGILVIHLSMGVMDILGEVLKSRRPTALFAAPYSGHEWSEFGALRNKPEGSLLECFLTSDLSQLASAVRPFRAIHHLREAKIINVSTRAPAAEFLKSVAEKYGTAIKTVGRQPVIDAYESVSQDAAEAETERWIRYAVRVIEPPREEIFRSCKLALAFDKLMESEQATVLTVDCYGSMYRQLPAFPCVGFVRLNNLGLGGICESDLACAMTHILFQGLTGKPGFISDPTMDESLKGIILAHCLGSMKMDGPDGETAPYQLRTIMERQEGCVPQVKMRMGQRVTQARFVTDDSLVYFTGEIIGLPDLDKGCRTKITVKIDGDPEKLWQNWSHGLHRVTVYGDILPDLKRFCRYKQVKLTDEA